jgi:ABC-type branched-subunit amino acid transport system substrate-binding protein
VAIGAVAAVIFIIIIVVYYYLPYSLLSFLSFANNANSEIVLLPPTDSKQTVLIGALLPLTGISSSLGESEEAALKIAFKDVNEKFLKIIQVFE